MHAALGDPARLAIVDRLFLSDRSPGELARDLSAPTNLIAHHLNVLEEAGVVERSRSEGDRRRTYVSLTPVALEVGGVDVPMVEGPGVGALGGHAAEEGAPGDVAVGAAVPRVVFVCTHNSARSQLAAATWAERSALPATSAGTRPADRVHPRAVATARRHGLRLVGGTRHVEETVRAGDLVVAVCDNAHEALAAAEHLHWSIPDPVRVGTDEAFEHALEVIDDRVRRLVAAVDPTEGRSA